jgi:hypothetical protein
MDINEQLETNALFEDMAPMGSKKVAVVVGRFNPPTKGHYAVINMVKKFIRDNSKLGLDVSPVVVIIGGSKSDADKKRNPLSVDERLSFMKGSGKANGVTFMTAVNAFAALAQCREKGLEPVAVAAGTDRIDDYIKILDKNFLTPDGSPIQHHKIHLERDEDATLTKKADKATAIDSTLANMKKKGSVDTDLVSGSLARRAVELGYEKEFAEIVDLADKPALAKKMFDKVAASIKE